MAFRPSFCGMTPFGSDFLSERTCQCAGAGARLGRPPAEDGDQRGDWGEVNAWQVPMGQIMASNLRLAGAVVYEVIDPNPGGGECRGGGAHRFQRKPDRRRSSLPAH